MLRQYAPALAVLFAFALLESVAPPALAQGIFVRLSKTSLVLNGDDLGFSLSADGRTGYFSRRTVRGHDIYEASRSDIGKPFSRVRNLVALNSLLWDTFPSITDDGLTLFFSRSDPDVDDSADLYLVKRDDAADDFVEAEKLPEPIQSAFTDDQPWISGDGLLLLFVSNRPGGAGAADIWVAAREVPDEPFPTPVNLNDFWPGSLVNSPLEESRPFLSDDRLTLVFSDGLRPPFREGGRGGGDLRVTTRPAANAPFGGPVNLDDFGLGSEVNGPEFDAWPVLSRNWPASGSRLYFSSQRGSAKSDIWGATWFSGDCVIAEDDTFPDCNENRVLDLCEIDAGAPDTNADGVLDHCAASLANLGLAAKRVNVADSGRWLSFSVDEDRQGADLNGDGDTNEWVLHIHDLQSGRTTNLGFAGHSLVFSEKWLAFETDENSHGADLNDDGDTDDTLLYVHELDVGETTRLGYPDRGSHALASNRWLPFYGDDRQEIHVLDFKSGETEELGFSGDFHALSDKWLAFNVDETLQGAVDLNGDGDRLDRVLHVHDLEEGETTNLEATGAFYGLSGKGIAFEERPGGSLHAYNLESRGTTDLGLAREFGALSSEWLLFYAREGPQDLNRDGDTGDWVLQMYDFDSGETANSSLAATERYIWELSVKTLAFEISEQEQNADLNADGDIDDVVLHVFDLKSGETKNSGLSGRIGNEFVGRWLAICIPEEAQVEDLNGDGDNNDSILHLYDLESGTAINFGFNVGANELLHAGTWLAFSVSEGREGRDLNGDGDEEDYVPHLHDLESGETTNLKVDALVGEIFGNVFGALSEKWFAFRVRDLNGDRDFDDSVAHVRHLETGETTNLAVAARTWALSGDRLALSVSESRQGEDLNGDGDAEDSILHVADLSALSPKPSFLRGDCDGDGTACSGVNDALELLSWLFGGRTEPPCLAACDPDGNGELDLVDAVYSLNFCFQGTDAPVAPFPSCGAGTETDAALGCETSACQ